MDASLLDIASRTPTLKRRCITLFLPGPLRRRAEDAEDPRPPLRVRALVDAALQLDVEVGHLRPEVREPQAELLEPLREVDEGEAEGEEEEGPRRHVELRDGHGEVRQDDARGRRGLVPLEKLAEGLEVADGARQVVLVAREGRLPAWAGKG